MTEVWHSLYLRSPEAEKVASTLRDALTKQGYILYDPFGLIPGAAYADSLKLFVAPAIDGWVRVLISPETIIPVEIMETISGQTLCFTLSFTDDNMKVTVYKDGQEAELSALKPYLKDGCSTNDLIDAMHAEAEREPEPISGDTFPMGVLPEDLKSAAQGLNPKHIDRMFVKLMKKVNRQLSGGDDEDEARSLLNNKQTNWKSTGAQRVSGFVACLNLPEKWNMPEFVTLRDAYQRHRHRQRNPHAHLFPGDAETMQAVPDALDYMPVYGGK